MRYWTHLEVPGIRGENFIFHPKTEGRTQSGSKWQGKGPKGAPKGPRKRQMGPSGRVRVGSGCAQMLWKSFYDVLDPPGGPRHSG